MGAWLWKLLGLYLLAADCAAFALMGVDKDRFPLLLALQLAGLGWLWLRWGPMG